MEDPQGTSHLANDLNSNASPSGSFFYQDHVVALPVPPRLMDTRQVPSDVACTQFRARVAMLSEAPRRLAHLGPVPAVVFSE